MDVGGLGKGAGAGGRILECTGESEGADLSLVPQVFHSTPQCSAAVAKPVAALHQEQ